MRDIIKALAFALIVREVSGVGSIKALTRFLFFGFPVVTLALWLAGTRQHLHVGERGDV
jgi:hypothetical protein